jgi:hypothetical protein
MFMKSAFGLYAKSFMESSADENQRAECVDYHPVDSAVEHCPGGVQQLLCKRP